MPTDVTPAPFRHSQHFPNALVYPNIPTSGWTGIPSPSPYLVVPIPVPMHRSPLPLSPLTPPMHLLPPTAPLFPPGQAMPMANQVLPNGMRNPWAPYAGQAYIPSSEKADRMAVDQSYGSIRSPGHEGGGSGGGSYITPGGERRGSVPIPIPASASAHRNLLPPLPHVLHSASGLRDPKVHKNGPASSVGSARSFVSGTSSISISSSHIDGVRVDDGWDGSQGRVHNGHLPDPTSTAGRLGRSPLAMSASAGARSLALGAGVGVGDGGGGGWRQAPSSWQNHARMTPGLLTPPASMTPSVGRRSARKASAEDWDMCTCRDCGSHAGDARSASGRLMKKVSGGSDRDDGRGLRVGQSPLWRGSPLRAA